MKTGVPRINSEIYIYSKGILIMSKDVFKELNKILFGRGPFVYAFKTKDVPNSLKIGYTSRSVGDRLEEWRKCYKNLEEVRRSTSRVDEKRAFYDTEVHRFLEDMPDSYKAKRRSKKKIRRLPKDKGKKIYSSEFFENADEDDFENAVKDIFDAAKGKSTSSYHFFAIGEEKTESETIARDQNYGLRDEQDRVVRKFKKAYEDADDKSRANKAKDHVYRKLLMYAVMRFGKTFTSLECARSAGAKLVVVVSAKKDVIDEWERQIASHENYENFVFLDQDKLCDKESEYKNKAIERLIKDGKTVVVALTLQSGKNIQKRVFGELYSRQIDLLIIDETHFGARGEELGKLLEEDDSADFEKNYRDAIKETNRQIKPLKSKVQLHLSGTPYRILLSNEFGDEDIIGYFSSADIQKIQGDESLKLELEGKPEWENPYFGFPQLIRFAFDFDEFVHWFNFKNSNPDPDISYSISEMLKPLSTEEDFHNSTHKKFKYEKQVLRLLNVIDGSNNGLETLGFLNYDKIKKGCMCRHMVWALPYKASCDAMETLLKRKKGIFKNLKKYEIINVAGLSNPMEPSAAIKKISRCEAKGKKTITLTVDKMLAGVTVKEWDTILFMKSSESPQEYDQAVFRVQNPYVVKSDSIIFDKKPQTLLVDFDMNRMFRMQENRSWFTTLDKNESLSDCIEQEVKKSPIFVLDPEKIKRVEASDVAKEIDKYTKKRTPIEEANNLTPDESLLNNSAFREMINSLNGLNSKTKSPFEMSKDKGGDAGILGSGGGNNAPAAGGGVDDEKFQTHKVLIQKMRTYYAKIFFYAFLTEDSVESIDEIIKSLKDSLNKESNLQIATSLGLETHYLKIISKGHKGNVLDLNRRIYAINKKKELSPDEQIKAVLKDFSRLSGSEIVTPMKLAKQMAELVPDFYGTGHDVIVDVGSRTGEMAYALQKHFGKDNVKNSIYSYCMSPLSYELTKKIYTLFGLNLKNIYLFPLKNSSSVPTLVDDIKKLKPSVIVGSPCFTADEEKNPIYHIVFERIRDNIKPSIIIMMMKAVWYSGGKGMDTFRRKFLDEKRIEVMHDYPDPQKCGMTSNLRGGICLFKWKRDYNGKCEFHCHINDFDDLAKRNLKTNLGGNVGDCDILLRYNHGIKILRKVVQKSQEEGYCTYNHYVTTRDPFGLGDKFKDYKEKESERYNLRLYLAEDGRGFVNPQKINKGKKLINKWKVFVAKASPGDDSLPHSVISSPVVPKEKKCVCTNSLYVVRTISNKKQAENLQTYMQTKFFRFLMIMAKNGQNMTNETYRFVPDVDLDKSWDDKKLYKHFGITSKKDKDYISRLVQDWSKKKERLIYG